MLKRILKLMNKGIVATNRPEIVKPNLKVGVPIKRAITPPKPTNLSLFVEKSTVSITWDSCRGATHYDVYLDTEIIGTVTSNQFTTTDELYGDIYISAYNAINRSELSNPLYIKTVPAHPTNLTATFATNSEGYDFEISFRDNSLIESQYRLEYSVDDGDVYRRNIAMSEGNGKTIITRFSAPEIYSQIVIRVIAINDVGENDIAEPITIMMSPVPVWTYKVAEQQVMLIWKNKAVGITEYKVRYNTTPDGEMKYDTIKNTEDKIGAELVHYIHLKEHEELKIALCAVAGNQSHAYGQDIIVGKALDETIRPPANFRYTWLDKGVAEISWEDCYDCENEFEIVLTEYGVNRIIKIPSTTKQKKGDTYKYVYTFERAGNLQIKARMIYELNESQYTQTLEINYIPVSGEPPAYVIKKRQLDFIVIQWEAQEFIEKYEIYLSVDGSEKVIDVSEDMYWLNEADYIGKDIEVCVVSYFVGGIVSQKSKTLRFKPTSEYYRSNIAIYDKVESKYLHNSMIIDKQYNNHVVDTKLINKGVESHTAVNVLTKTLMTTELNDIETFTWGKGTSWQYPLNCTIYLTESIQSDTPLTVLSFDKTSTNIPIETTVTTAIKNEYAITTEINKIRIMTIGDSITAGHPNHWAETMTGDERSQYQYWLNRRLKGTYEIINKGYGSDTTDRMLARFDKDVLGYNASFCIIQGGTNDIYWAMAETDGNQAALDMKVQLMKDNLTEMIKRCWDNNIHPIVGTLIPRTGAVGIYKEALYNYNEWIRNFCKLNDNIDCVDFFNAGKDSFPPTPLEDPTNPGALNPMYDGDAIYDDYGNLIKQGRGIHPSVEGYKIMGEAIPLNLFRAQDEGLKMYLDKDCTREEEYNKQDELNPFYLLTVDNMARGKSKHIIRYVKNVGSSQVLFAAFVSKKHSVEVRFINEDGTKGMYANALLHPGRVVEIKIEFNILNEDSSSTAKLHLASRKIITN